MDIVIWCSENEKIYNYLPCLTSTLGKVKCPSGHGLDFHRPHSQITIDSPDFHPRRSQNCLRGYWTGMSCHQRVCVTVSNKRKNYLAWPTLSARCGSWCKNYSSSFRLCSIHYHSLHPVDDDEFAIPRNQGNHRLTLVKGLYSFWYFLHPMRISNLPMHVFILYCAVLCCTILYTHKKQGCQRVVKTVVTRTALWFLTTRWQPCVTILTHRAM